MDELLGIRHMSTGREGTGERKWLAIVGPEGIRDLIEIEAEDENACLVAGHVVLERGGEKPALWAYPFSRDELAITGEPFFLWPGTSPVASRDGDLFYLSEGSEGMRQLAWLDEDGELELFDQPRATNAWAQGVSPDGSRVAFADGKEIWVHDVEQERSVMVATVEERIASLHYLPGYRILVVAMGKALLLPDGPGEAVEWDVPGMVMSVSLDGSRALVSDMAERRLLLQPLRDAMPAGEPEVLREGVRGFSSMSPDGRWYLFSSDHSGAEQYYLSRYPDTGEVWTLGIGGTVFVMFGPRGDEILVAALTGRRTLSAMSFTPDPEPRFGALETRFDLGELNVNSIFFPFDPTTGRFVVNKWSAPSDTRIVLVQNWRGPDAER
jgi:hypothetical protein